jgi:hypothetical protein
VVVHLRRFLLEGHLRDERVDALFDGLGGIAPERLGGLRGGSRASEEQHCGQQGDDAVSQTRSLRVATAALWIHRIAPWIVRFIKAI